MNKIWRISFKLCKYKHILFFMNTAQCLPTSGTLVYCYRATINGYWLFCASAVLALARCITTHDCTITWRHIKATPCLTSLTCQLVSCSRLSVFSSLATRVSARSPRRAAQFQDRFDTLFYFLSDILCSCVVPCVLFSDGGWYRYCFSTFKLLVQVCMRFMYMVEAVRFGYEWMIVT